MTNDDIAHLRLLADWHGQQARYLLLAVPAGQHDQGRFHPMAAARLSRLADEATMNRGNDLSAPTRAGTRTGGPGLAITRRAAGHDQNTPSKKSRPDC